jgi:two-component system, cell cycle sensor histidine kinase and response regulator CckA
MTEKPTYEELEKKIQEFEHKQMESSLKKSEIEIKSIFRAAPTGIGVVCDRLIQEVNDRFCEITGYSKTELIGQNARMVYTSDEEYEYVGSEKYRMIKEKGTGTVETHFKRKNGEIINVLLSSTPIDPKDLSAGVTFTALDITQHKKAEDALKASELKYRLLADNVKDVIWTMDMGQNFTYCSPSIQKLRGYTPEETLQIPLENSLTPESYEKAVQVMAEEIGREGKPGVSPDRYQILELENIRKDGSTVWCEVTISFLRNENGLATGMIGITHDITERRKQEEDFRKSERKFRLLADHTYDWEYWVNKDGDYVYISPACERITGYRPEEIISDPQLVSKMVKPDYAKKVSHHYQEENNKDTPVFSMEFPIIAKNGEEVWLKHTCNPVYDELGKYAGRRGNNRDITEQKRAADELRSAFRLYEDIIASSPVGITIYDDVGDCISANEMAAEVIGATKAQLLQQNYHQLDSWKKSGLYDIALDTMQSKMKNRHEIKVKSTFGNLCILDIHLVPIDIGETAHLLLIFDDISERRNLEDQYHHAQKMESIGRLAGGVAHDFNNALSVIKGFTEMALDDTDPKGQLHEDLNEIHMAANRAADITRQLLAFARKQTIAPTILDLNENVESILKMLRRLIGEDIDFAWLPGANLWSVKMDSTQIDQILANLCVNARDAIEGVGKVTIESENATLTNDYCIDHTGFVPGEFVKLSVSDNGCGMNKEVLDNIFEPFFTTKDVGKGTGLGLATVYGIVKQNNGFINVYSEPDIGTTIKIYLPTHGIKAVEDHKEKIEEFPISKGETVLVVEDDPSILNIMQKILEHLGYSVLTSSAPEKTKNIVKEYTSTIHLLITDVIMPKMNGRDLAEQLQTDYPDLKCIFMSGYTADAIVNQEILDKKVNFIQKPFSRIELAEIVRKVLDEN